MANRVKINRRAVRQLLRSDAILVDLQNRAARIAEAAGDGFEVDSGVGRNRARASVRTVTYQAMRAESTTRALTRAIDAGR